MNTAAVNTVDAPTGLRTVAVSLLRGRGFTAVRVVLGVVLLTAAVLKLSGSNVTALPRVAWFSTPRVQVAAAAWELVLGLWLLSRASRAWAWLAAFGTFFAFAGVSGYFGWTGVASCGCFGAIRASPWTACGVDVAALVLLGVTRPDFRDAGSFRLPTGLSVAAAGTAAVLIALIGLGSWAYGSPQAALARLRGEPLTVSTDYVDFGTQSVGEQLEATVQVRNWSDRPVELIGGTSDCSCVTTADLPVTIPPGEGHPVTIKINVPPAKPGTLTRVVELWTNYDKQHTIRLQVGCKVVE